MFPGCAFSFPSVCSSSNTFCHAACVYWWNFKETYHKYVHVFVNWVGSDEKNYRSPVNVVGSPFMVTSLVSVAVSHHAVGKNRKGLQGQRSKCKVIRGMFVHTLSYLLALTNPELLPSMKHTVYQLGNPNHGLILPQIKSCLLRSNFVYRMFLQTSTDWSCDQCFILFHVWCLFHSAAAFIVRSFVTSLRISNVDVKKLLTYLNLSGDIHYAKKWPIMCWVGR